MGARQKAEQVPGNVMEEKEMFELPKEGEIFELEGERDMFELETTRQC